MLNDIRRMHVALALTVSMALTGCGDSPTDHHEEEPDPHGVIISDMGVPLVTVHDGIVTGSLTVAAGQETADLDIVFTDHDGDPITGDLSEYFADATVMDTGVAIFHSTADFEAHFEGISAGATTVVIHFMHPPGPTAHSNYDSPAIDITVTP